MINTKELEKRWYKYKTKGVLLVVSILAILSLLIYGGYYILYKLDLNIEKKEQPKKAVLSATRVVVKEKNISTPIEKKSIEKGDSDNSVMLSPTIPVIDLEKEKLKDIRARKRAIDYNIAKKTHHKPKKRLVKAKASTYLTASELAEVNGNRYKAKREKKKINMKLSSSNYMSVMKQKFKQNKNPREALLIAQAYYDAGNYKKAEEWALIANNLDKTSDESWLLFAKAKDKLGKRREALKILVVYYNKSKSSKVKALIDKMKSKSI
ncbi:MAG: hypothetical protein GXO60_04460 [Epsilonproteobacteria bacterium]|nr:hypothetical protein [Campylobacterota bacterium]